MSNKAINSLGYTGIVTLSQYIGNKKIKILQKHNTGGSSLFDFLSDCLCGDFTVAELKRPMKIMLLKKNTDPASGSITYVSKSNFINLISKPVKINKGSVIYSFVISRDILLSNEAADFDAIGLYTNSITNITEANDFAAICNVSSEDQNTTTFSSSSALIIDWQLIISNKE
jgi:hypothetical protein